MKLHVQECNQCRRIRIQLDGDNEWSGWFPKGAFKLEKHHTIQSHARVDCGHCPVFATNFPARPEQQAERR